MQLTKQVQVSRISLSKQVTDVLLLAIAYFNKVGSHNITSFFVEFGPGPGPSPTIRHGRIIVLGYFPSRKIQG